MADNTMDFQIQRQKKAAGNRAPSIFESGWTEKKASFATDPSIYDEAAIFTVPEEKEAAVKKQSYRE